MNIYDEINFLKNPYRVLKISENSDDATIKDAYKLIRNSANPEAIEIIDEAFNLIKTRDKRLRYSLICNVPYESIDAIKELGVVPKRLSKKRWLELIGDNDSKS